MDTYNKNKLHLQKDSTFTSVTASYWYMNKVSESVSQCSKNKHLAGIVGLKPGRVDVTTFCDDTKGWFATTVWFSKNILNSPTNNSPPRQVRLISNMRLVKLLKVSNILHSLIFIWSKQFALRLNSTCSAVQDEQQSVITWKIKPLFHMFAHRSSSTNTPTCGLFFPSRFSEDRLEELHVLLFMQLVPGLVPV